MCDLVDISMQDKEQTILAATFWPRLFKRKIRNVIGADLEGIEENPWDKELSV